MLRLLALLVACLTLASGARGQTCSTSWENPVDGDWDDETKWTAGVPGSTALPGGVDPCITVDGTYTVTIRPDYAPTINLQTMTIGGSSGTQTLLSGGYIRLTDLSIGARGRMEINPVSGLFRGLEASGTVLVEGFLSKDSNVGVFLNNEGDVEVASGATLRGTNGVRLGGPNGTFTIRGTVELADGGRIDARTEVLGGTVRATSGEGTLFNGGGILRNATLDAASGATLIVNGSYALEGTLSGSPDGEVYVYASRLTAEASGVTLDVTGTGLRFGRPSVAQGPTTLTGGPVTNTGRLVFAASNFFSRIEGTTLTNEGALDLEGNMGMSEGAVVRNRPGGVLRMVGTQIYQNPNTSVVRIENAGLIVRDDVGPGEVFSRFVNVTLESLPGSEIRVLDEYMDFAGQDLALPPGMMLTGSGTLRMAGLPIRSTFSPGTEADPIGTLGPRDLDTFVLAPEAITVLDVAPGGVGDMFIDNNNRGASMTLGGTLRVRARPGFTPSIGDAWTIAVNGGSLIQGAFSAVETEGVPAGVSFAVDTSQPSTAILRAVASVSVSAPLAQAQEGTPMSFVLSHPASPEAFTINVETGGTATPFADYTLSATRGTVRARPNTTQTTVQVFPRRDANDSEGNETVTLRIVVGLDAAPGTSPEASVTITDGPSNAALALDGISPARGGNNGRVTPTVYGTGFGADATLRLVRGGTSIDASGVAFASGGSGASGQFDLAGVATGTYDLEVTSGGSTETLSNAFEVVEGIRAAPLWVDVTGTTAPRFGRWSTYTIHMGNDGDVDLYDVGLLVRITEGIPFEFMEGIRDYNGTPASELDISIDVDGAQVVPLYFHMLPARSSGSFRVRVLTQAPLSSGDGVGVAAELYPPDVTRASTYTGDLADGLPFNFGLIAGGFEVITFEFPPPDGLPRSPAASRAPWASGADAKRDDNVGPFWDRDRPISEYTDAQIFDEYDTAGRFNEWYGTEIEPQTQTTVDTYGGAAIAPIANEAALAAGYTLVAGTAVVVSGVLTMWTIRSYGLKAHQIQCSRGIPLPEECLEYLASQNITYDPNTGFQSTLVVGKAGASGDPNDKYGPVGEGGQRYYNPTEPSVYTIAFENMPTASFPAQEVIVVDSLDVNAFDLSTFSLGPIRWGASGVVTPPPGAKTFETEVSLMPDLNATLLITAALDEATGRVEWHFVTLDPTTGDLPENGLIGFLPPNTTSPEGEGTVGFTVQVRENLASGAMVDNGAEIIFDVNEPIVTPVWSNTLDRVEPVSSVQALAGTESNPVTLMLNGSDSGSGVEFYNVYASKDGGPFLIAGVSTNGTFEFEGESGSTYGFFSIAQDFVDNIEGPKTEAEATTMVAVAGETGPDGPLALTLASPRPNPARGLVRLRYGVPASAAVDVRVLDALGREVAVLARGEAPAGWHEATWTPGVASGVYVVEVRAGDEVQHRRVTVVR